MGLADVGRHLLELLRRILEALDVHRVEHDGAVAEGLEARGLLLRDHVDRIAHEREGLASPLDADVPIAVFVPGLTRKLVGEVGALTHPRHTDVATDHGRIVRGDLGERGAHRPRALSGRFAPQMETEPQAETGAEENQSKRTDHGMPPCGREYGHNARVDQAPALGIDPTSLVHR